MAQITLTPQKLSDTTKTDPKADITLDKAFKPGKYTFSLTVTDDLNPPQSSSPPGTWVVEVRDLPVAKISGPRVVGVGRPISLTGEGSTPAGNITSYTWTVTPPQ
jgi:hypothetical protein